jgi:hypothetical protein
MASGKGLEGAESATGEQRKEDEGLDRQPGFSFVATLLGSITRLPMMCS